MISREEIDGLAELARLKLSPEEAQALQKDISSILDYVGQVSGVSGTAHSTPAVVRNVMRDDAVRSGDSLIAGKEKQLLEAAPRREGDYVVVRKIIQKDE